MKKKTTGGEGNSFLSYVTQILIALTIIGSATLTCMGLMFNYVNSKSLEIEIGCLAIFVLTLCIISWKQIRAVIMNSRIVQAVLVFVLISAIATFLGKDPALSFYGHFERGTGLFFLLVSVFGTLFALMAAHANHAVRRAVLYPLAIAGGILGFLTWLGSTGFATSFWVVLGPSSGGGATMGNSSYAGTILIMTFFIALYLFLTADRTWKKALLAIIGFFILFNPVIITLPFLKPATGTAFGFIGDARGAAISLITGLAMALGVSWMYSARNWVRNAGRALAALIIVGTVFGVVLLVLPGNKIHNGFIKESGAARFIYWNMAVDQWKDHPILGTGPETFRYAHERFFDPQLFVLGEPWADKPHNAYVEMLLTTGIFGGIAYLSIFGFMIMMLARMRDPKHRIFVATSLGLITAYMLNNIILFDTVTSLFMFFLIVFWVASETEWRILDIPAMAAEKFSHAEIAAKIIVAIAVILPVSIIIHGEEVKLNLGWQELFASLPARSALYAQTEAASPYGAGISFAQRADDYAQQYGSDTTTDPQVAVNDIVAITRQLVTTMEKYPPNMQSYDALAKLSIDQMRYLNKATPELISQLRLAGEGINQVSQSRNPLGAVYIARADHYAGE